MRESDVLCDFLQTAFPTTVKANMPFFILNLLGAEYRIASDSEDELLAYEKQTPPGMIRNYIAANQSTAPLPASMVERIFCRLFSQEEAHKWLWEPLPQKMLGFPDYPSDWPGLLRLSRLGFAHDGRFALFALNAHKHALAGWGRMFVMELTGTTWKTTSSRIGPETIS